MSPSDANNKGVNWNSTNTSVATIDGNGKVTCLAAGTTTITATAADGSGVSASLTLTVKNPLTSLELSTYQTTILKDGFTSTITATTNPSSYDASYISWSISDTSIATVSVSGKTATITSKSNIGTATLTVSAGGITKTVNISVTNFSTTTYSYTGSVQQVDLPAGTYKLEVWGAQGGRCTSCTETSTYFSYGYGGYSVGALVLDTSTTVYVVVGGQGKSANNGTRVAGGYNGGGDGCGGGGGATHIAKRTGLLKNLSGYQSDVLIVAGGGGGTEHISSEPEWGGSGGGYIGQGISSSTSGTPSYYNNSGSQTSGYAFGLGQSSSNTNDGGGGGGWYGGTTNNISNCCGGGGSGYIGGVVSMSGVIRQMFTYRKSTIASYDTSRASTADATSTSYTTNVSSTATSNYAKSGDGYAKITIVN